MGTSISSQSSEFQSAHPVCFPENKPEKIVQSCEKMQEKKEPEIIDVAELMKDLEEEEDDDEMGLEDYNDNKENIGPCSQKPQQHHKGVSQNGNRAKTESKQRGVLEEKKSSPARADSNSNRKSPLLDTDIPSFRRPDLNSSSLFDPNLLAAFEQAVKEHARMTEEQRTARVEVESPQKVEDGDPDTDPLMFFEEKCPPGGDGTVIFYTTTLRGIRKTFEDCSKIRFLLQSFKILFLRGTFQCTRSSGMSCGAVWMGNQCLQGCLLRGDTLEEQRKF
ncbi:glutaredoxin domain-containing cysteine-rich protein [Spatholobus suberectus]|nr:glutaredoxin domain-containing cysteine-rich protein [Spatholobus suberectus]